MIQFFTQQIGKHLKQSLMVWGVLPYPLARSLNGTEVMEDTLVTSKTKNVETLRTQIPLLNHYPRETLQKRHV